MFPIESKFTKAKLDTKFNYIFDCREEMYYWCGKVSPPFPGFQYVLLYLTRLAGHTGH